jgi:periplasmic protein TonB
MSLFSFIRLIFFGSPWLWISFGLHAVLIFGSGIFLFQRAQYELNPGRSSTEVNLIASADGMTGDPVPMENEMPLMPPAAPVPVVSGSMPDEPVVVKKVSTGAGIQRAVSMSVAERSLRKGRASDDPAGKGGAPVSAHSGDGVPSAARPDALNNIPPAYPEEARLKGQSGVVLLRVGVTERGRVSFVEVESGSGFKILDETAVRAVNQWKFIPAASGSRPVGSILSIPVRFRLDLVSDNRGAMVKR